VRRWAVLALLLAAVAALWAPAANLVLAARMGAAVRSLSSGDDAATLPVSQTKVVRRSGERDLAALLYRPLGGAPDRAAVLVPGVSERGCYHPRLVALARALASKGFVVLTPDIESFRRFEVAPEALEEIAFWHGALPDAAGIRPHRRGIIGISFSGTLALLAAARPESRDSVDFVLAIGPYDDLGRLAEGWFAAGPRTVAEGRYPNRCYGKWILMLQALDLLPDAGEREFLRAALHKLLLEGKAPPTPPSLGPEAARWYRAATLPETESDPEVARRIKEHLEPLYRRLSPAATAGGVRAAVFLAHGAFDDLIASSESGALAARLPAGQVHVLITPFLTHTHPLDKPLTLGAKARGVSDMLGFLYALARVAR
jgi:hypothetical protein